MLGQVTSKGVPLLSNRWKQQELSGAKQNGYPYLRGLFLPNRNKHFTRTWALACACQTCISLLCKASTFLSKSISKQLIIPFKSSKNVRTSQSKQPLLPQHQSCIQCTGQAKPKTRYPPVNRYLLKLVPERHATCATSARILSIWPWKYRPSVSRVAAWGCVGMDEGRKSERRGRPCRMTLRGSLNNSDMDSGHH